MTTTTAAPLSAEQLDSPRAAFEDRHIGYEFPSQALRRGAFEEFAAGWKAALIAQARAAGQAEPVYQMRHQAGGTWTECDADGATCIKRMPHWADAYEFRTLYTTPQATAPQPVGEQARRHELKTDPVVFAAVLAGAKTHEIRKNDRDFAVGDELLLRETTHTGAEIAAGAPLAYTGRELLRTVSHVLTGYGLQDGWCILSLARAALDMRASSAPAEAPTNEMLEELWEATHYGHPADFAADVLQRWGGWQDGLLGYGGKLNTAAATPAATASSAPAEHLTDEQIMRIAGDVRQRNTGSWPGDVAFARAVLAASPTATPSSAATAAQAVEARADFDTWWNTPNARTGHPPSATLDPNSARNAWEAAQAQQAAAPTDYVLMPRRLTAENGSKGALSGEFKESIRVTCPECDGSGEMDDEIDCGECSGEGTVEQMVVVGWDTIKDIYKRAVELLATPAAAAAPAELTASQIAAGAAVLDDDGKPVGRNVAIMVADAMQVAPAEDAKDAAPGNREDYYLMANARRVAEKPIYAIRSMPNWVFASELFATGSTAAYQICRDAGIDPDGYKIDRATLASTQHSAKAGGDK